MNALTLKGGKSLSTEHTKLLIQFLLWQIFQLTGDNAVISKCVTNACGIIRLNHRD